VLPEDLQAVDLKSDRLARHGIVGKRITATHIVSRPGCRDERRTRAERRVEDLPSEGLRLSQPRDPGTPALCEEECRELSCSGETVPIAA